MKKQNLSRKLSLKTSKVSKVGNENAIVGGATTFCLSQPVCAFTDQPRCTHTIGNGQDENGNPCTI